MTSPVLGIDLTDGLATLTLRRPDALNALNAELKDALAEWIRGAWDSDEVRAVLLVGEGRAFCAGGDLTEMDPQRSPEGARVRQEKLLRQVFVPLAQFPKPVVAAVHGHAHGAGLSLALACDMVVAAEDAPMSVSFTQRGLVPDCGALYFLPRIVGVARAKELLLTGRRFTGKDAEAMGLVMEAVPQDQVLTVARDRAKSLAAGATVALGLTKSLVDRSWNLALEQVADLEAFASAVTRSSSDHHEALASFREKRPASFTGK